MGPIDEDPRWLAFPPFHEYLLTEFPLMQVFYILYRVSAVSNNAIS